MSILDLSGCQQGSGSNESENADGGPVTLQFQSLSDQPTTQAAVQSIVDEWNTDSTHHPGHRRDGT